MARVRWADLDSKLYEDMVSVLLSHLHPESARIDGAGGDGGRDVQIATPKGIKAFELKSFTGRMGNTQRAQVKASLTKVKELKPIHWTLIVPIDFTPDEITWFNTLTKLVSFPINRRGKTWLDAQFARRPYIARYFLEDAANEIARLAQVLGQEKATLAGGAPDALERIGRIVDQLNEIDPFYRFEVTVGEGIRQIRVSPRYVGAERDKPIKGTFTLRFPNDEAGRAAAAEFQHAVDFGTKVHVAPEYIAEATFAVPGQPDDLEPTSMEIGPSIFEPTTKTLILVCSSPDGKRVVELPIDFNLESRGEGGSIWKGKDRTGTLTVVLTADAKAHKFHVSLSLHQVDSYYPQDMWPLARFLAALVPPNSFALHQESGERITEPTDAGTEPWIAEWMPRFMEDLVLVQTAAGMVRKVPKAVDLNEMNAIGTAAALLRGEEISGEWERLLTTIRAEASDEDRSKLSEATPVTLITHDSHEVTYAGVNYRVGKRVQMRYESARLGGIAVHVGDEVETAPLPEEWADVVRGGTEVVLIPGASNVGHISLLSDIGEAEPSERPANE